MPHNEHAVDHACQRIADIIRDAYELELTEQEVRDVIDNTSIRSDLEGDVEVAILTEALEFGLSPAVPDARGVAR